MKTFRKTKIICTVGPSTSSYEMLMKMHKAGMNAVRLNMSHGTHESHLEVIRTVRKINDEVGDAVAVILDTQGPEIRTGVLQSDLHISEGDVITVSARPEDVEQSSIHINYEGIMNEVQVGEKITVDNGLINLKVLEKNQGTMKCRVIDGGTMKSNRHVNLPGIRVNLPSITDKDKSDIRFGIKNKVDYIAISFVREAGDVQELREFIGPASKTVKIISKIEDREGVRNVEEIVKESDGVMVARGDLGIEINLEELPDVQRIIVGRCHQKGKRVIVATHLLESMIENPIPTRAEVTDVANAVYEEVDAVMLSGETAIGKHPLKSIEYINRIALRAEKLKSLQFGKLLMKKDRKQHIAASAADLAESIEAAALVVITKRGLMAQLVTNCRPSKVPIHAVTLNSGVKRQLALNRAVTAHTIDHVRDPEQRILEAFKLLKEKEFLAEGDHVVLVSDIITATGIDSIQIRKIT